MTEGERPNQPEQSPEHQLVSRELIASEAEGRDINSIAARIIANWFHEGQASGMVSFVTTGAIDSDQLLSELRRVIHDDPVDPFAHSLVSAFTGYISRQPDLDEHGNRGPQPNWHEATKDWGDREEQPATTEVFDAYLEFFGNDQETARQFPERYLGTFDSLTAYAEHIAQELDYVRAIDDVMLADDVKKYVRFDFEAFGHDMWVDGEIAVLHLDDGRAAIFRNRT
jgi:hypothetical protein